MSDARHSFLMFAPDFCNPAYGEQTSSGTILIGRSSRRSRADRPARRSSRPKRILAIVIAFGGRGRTRRT